MVDVSEELAGRLHACDEQYALHFAGQPRLTSDAAMLAALVAEVAAVATAARQAGAAAVVDLAATQQAAYAHEQAQIEAEQAAAGPSGRAVAGVQRRAALLMHRYDRHFAGRSRADRELGLLRELIDDFDVCRHTLTQLLGHGGAAPGAVVAATDDYAAMLRREQAAILAARAQGTPTAQAVSWGRAANTLLATYERLCVGRRQLGVRPALWARLHADLVDCQAAMQQLAAAGLQLPHHEAALGQLARQLQQWEEEHAALVRAHEGAEPSALHAAVDAELDDALAAYNALGEHPEATALAALCDRLEELERVARGHGQAGAASAVVALDALGLVCGSYDAARAAS